MSFIDDTALYPEGRMAFARIHEDTRATAVETFMNRPRKDALKYVWEFFQEMGVTWPEYGTGATLRTKYYNAVMSARERAYNLVKVDLDPEELEEHLQEVTRKYALAEKSEFDEQANSRYTPGSARAIVENYDNIRWDEDRIRVEWNLFKAITGRDGLSPKSGHIFSLHKDILQVILAEEYVVVDYKAFEPRIASDISGTMKNLFSWDGDFYNQCSGERQDIKDSFISALYGMSLGNLTPSARIWSQENLGEYMNWATEVIKDKPFLITRDCSWIYPTFNRSKTQIKNALVQPEAASIIRRAYSTAVEEGIPVICHQHDSLIAPAGHGYGSRLKVIMEDLGYPTDTSYLEPRV